MSETQPRPPIVKRSVTLVAELSEEVFYGSQPQFKQRISEVLPFHEANKNWEVNFTTKDGTPEFSQMRPKVNITDCYYQKNENGNRLFSLEVERSTISFVLQRTEATHAYADLRAYIEQCLPIYLDSFRAPKILVIGLDYTNLISRGTTPDFLETDGSIRIGELLTVFNHFPGKFESLMPPYDCRIGLVLDLANQIYSTIQVRGLQQKIDGGSAILVALNARQETKPRIFVAQEILEILDILHNHVSDSYQNVFTDTAKASFGT